MITSSSNKLSCHYNVLARTFAFSIHLEMVFRQACVIVLYPYHASHCGVDRPSACLSVQMNFLIS